MENQTPQRNLKRYFPALIGLLALGLGAWLFYLVQTGRIAKGNPVCSVCERPLHPAQVFAVVSKNGRELRTCCPRCGLRFAIESGATPSQATAFSNGKLIDAETAFYLEGSDLMACCASTTMRTDTGMICEMHYDRCMPSLVAFANVKEAQTYQQEHGGQLIDLAGARRSVAQQMGR
jgi:ribosomal protein S27AE